MAHCVEVIVTTDTNNSFSTSSVWNPVTAVNLMGYKNGGIAESRTLNFVGDDYLVVAESSKPLLHVWQLNSQMPVRDIRFVMPGKITALAVSRDGMYIVAGIDEKIYIWHTLSGTLLTMLERHYQTVCNIKFTPDDKFFISSSLDGTVMVWALVNVVGLPEYGLLTQTIAGRHDPMHLSSHHTLKVTDLCISKMGIVSRLATVSIDRTCKIMNLTSGELLLNVIFPEQLYSVTFDILELCVFVGSSTGNIYQIDLANDYGNKEVIYGSEVEKQLFSGHSKGVTCLSVSFQGKTLMSGSSDCTIRIWDIASRQQINIITLKGSVTNAFFTMNKQNIYKDKFVPKIMLQTLKRSQGDMEIVMDVFTPKNNFWQKYMEIEPKICVQEKVVESEIAPEPNGSKYKDEIKALKKKVDQITKMNNHLYQIAVSKVTEKSNRKRRH